MWTSPAITNKERDEGKGEKDGPLIRNRDWK